MFRQGKGRFGPGAVVIMLAVCLAPGAVPAIAAGPEEGGMNARIHKPPPRSKGVIHCRICAGRKCAVVAVRGRCTKHTALAALERRMKQRPKQQKAITPPAIDDRKYRQLQEETRRRVPRHTPEWTDQNQSDPGMSILEAARRNPGSIRVEPAPSSFLPEVGDEVLSGFERSDRK